MFDWRLNGVIFSGLDADFAYLQSLHLKPKGGSATNSCARLYFKR